MIADIETTEVFETYWHFAVARQEVYFARLRQAPPPWSQDSIISSFRFTNAYRAADRVSQYLIRHVIYQDDVPLRPDDILFRILVFKIFNRIDTWELLSTHLGPITYQRFSVEAFDRVLTEAMAQGTAIYSAAYIMPSGRSLGHRRKHRNHLALLDHMMRASLPLKIARASRMRDVFEFLLSFPTIGPFLAYQYATDINYSELTDFSEREFVAPGPGAIDGIRKSISDRAGLTDADIIRRVTDAQIENFERRGLSFPDLFGRPLQYIDCQNLFCEVGKYSRVAHPEHRGSSGRSRIKQRYVGEEKLPRPWFPPKWGINERVSDFFGSGGTNGSG